MQVGSSLSADSIIQQVTGVLRGLGNIQPGEPVVVIATEGAFRESTTGVEESPPSVAPSPDEFDPLGDDAEHEAKAKIEACKSEFVANGMSEEQAAYAAFKYGYANKPKAKREPSTFAKWVSDATEECEDALARCDQAHLRATDDADAAHGTEQERIATAFEARIRAILDANK